jgi:hypothetical protein
MFLFRVTYLYCTYCVMLLELARGLLIQHVNKLDLLLLLLYGPYKAIIGCMHILLTHDANHFKGNAI